MCPKGQIGKLDGESFGLGKSRDLTSDWKHRDHLYTWPCGAEELTAVF